MKAVLRLDNLEASPAQVEKGLKAVQEAFKSLMDLPDKKRRTLRTRRRMLRLQMLKGYLEGLKRIR